MADHQEHTGGLFGGLKKLLFKDEAVTISSNSGPATPPPLPPTPVVPPPLPVDNNVFTTTSDDQTRAKAYQLLESVNQPGVDFLEVWNAAEENGGATGSNIKTAFNALKFADKSLTKDKVLSTGRYYIAELQKALDADLARKTQQRQQLDDQKNSQRRSLSESVAATEQQIADLQQSLTDKKKQLAELDAAYEPRIADLARKMESGKATINHMLRQMQDMLAVVEKEL